MERNMEGRFIKWIILVNCFRLLSLSLSLWSIFFNENGSFGNETSAFSVSFVKLFFTSSLGMSIAFRWSKTTSYFKSTFFETANYISMDPK